MRSVSSRSNPLVAVFRELAAAPDRSGARLLLDGAHLVREALDAGLAFECVAVSSSLLDANGEEAALARAIAADGPHVVSVTEPVLRAMSPVKQPSGLVAIARRPTPDVAALEDNPHALFLVVADVQDPGNLGALIRVADAAGASQVVVCGSSAQPFGWRALRGSMGSTLRMPLAQFPQVENAIDTLLASGTRIVAAVPRGGRAPHTVTWTGRVAVVLGGEGAGLSDSLLKRCDERVTIPMRAPVESLNVAAAGAVLVYAAHQQRSPLETLADPIASGS